MSGGRLYALQFSDGTIKVGVSSSPVSRWRLLSSGKRPVSAVCSPWIQWAHRRAERELLGRMRGVFVSARDAQEWFYGVDFGAVETLLRQTYRSYGDGCGWRTFISLMPFARRDAGDSHPLSARALRKEPGFWRPTRATRQTRDEVFA